jgi:outer membrane protein assembly factor BamA
LWLHARAVVRTAEEIEWDRIGHDARAEVRFGNGLGVGVGAAAFDVVDAVQSWHLTDHETALAAAVLHRDYRDYFGKHGGRAFVSAFFNEAATLRLGYGRERWTSRDERDPWSLFRQGEPWRENPSMDEGHVRLLTGSLVVDTRSSTYSPGAGWYVQADIERGDFDQKVATGTANREYTRGFLDARRYNRLGPGAQFNIRMVVGGWLEGDALPLQRRLSVGGAGTLPGFDFGKSTGRGADRLQCSEGSNAESQLPALCDRVALLQVEYRGDLSWHGHDGDDSRWWPHELHTPTWVVFADAGRGWRARDDGVTTHPIQSFPDFKTFETDVGVGLDFGSASISVAKSLSDRDEPANFVVRLSRRF